MSVDRVVQAVRSDSFAGVERYICDVSGELARRGWRVTVVGGDPVQVVRRLPPGTQHLPAKTAAQVGRALLRVGRGTVVHAHMTAAEVPAVLAKPVTRAPVVCTRHFPKQRGDTWGGRVLRGLVRAGIDRQISTSRFVATSIQEPSTVLYSGVPPVITTPDAIRECTVVVMQRHEAEKCTDVAVRAWAEAGARERGWRLLVIGSGSLTGQLRRLAEELGVAGTIDFAGFLADTGDVLSRAGIFLATTPVEAFGLSVVEAMARGVPVLAAAAGGHLETLGDAGVMFPPGDVAACAAGIDRLADDPVLRAALGSAAIERQRSCFSINGHVDALESIYRELLA